MMGRIIGNVATKASTICRSMSVCAAIALAGVLGGMGCGVPQAPPPAGPPPAPAAPNPIPGIILASATEDIGALERAVALELNRMRENPAVYGGRILRTYRHFYDGLWVRTPGSYFTLQTREGTSAVDEAMEEIGGFGRLHGLWLSPGLSRAARDHARDIGAHGSLDHFGSQNTTPHERMSRYGTVRGLFAESIAAGYDAPVLIMAQLLVDDAVSSRFNRHNLLSPDFRSVGVGCAPHAEYVVVCVLSFAEQYKG